MSKPTLLEMVQDILAAGNGDTINSIFDGVESEQIARAVGDVYDVLRIKLELPETYSLFELNASTDPSKPVYMTRPSIATTIDWLKYDKKTALSDPSLMTDMRFLTLEDFLEYSYSLDGAATNVASTQIPIQNATVEIRYRTDVPPTYFTSWDTSDILFDAYASSLESTLQKSKTLAYGKLSTDFQLLDTWVAPLDEDKIVLLKQKAKTQVFTEVYQVEHGISAKNARTLEDKITRKYNDRQYASPYNFGRRTTK